MEIWRLPYPTRSKTKQSNDDVLMYTKQSHDAIMYTKQSNNALKYTKQSNDKALTITCQAINGALASVKQNLALIVPAHN